MKKLIMAALFLAASNLQAAGFSYNNVSISYANVDLDAGFVSVDGDGFDFEGNFEVHKNIFIPVRYQSIGYDFSVDGTMWLAGIGGHMPLSSTVDLFGMLQFGNFELEGPLGSADSDTLALTAGIRTALAQNLEAALYVTTIDFDDGDDQSGVGAKLNFYFNKTTSLVARAEFLSDIDTLSIGAQFDF